MKEPAKIIQELAQHCSFRPVDMVEHCGDWILSDSARNTCISVLWFAYRLSLETEEGEHVKPSFAIGIDSDPIDYTTEPLTMTIETIPLVRRLAKAAGRYYFAVDRSAHIVGLATSGEIVVNILGPSVIDLRCGDVTVRYDRGHVKRLSTRPLRDALDSMIDGTALASSAEFGRDDDGLRSHCRTHLPSVMAESLERTMALLRDQGRGGLIVVVPDREKAKLFTGTLVAPPRTRAPLADHCLWEYYLSHWGRLGIDKRKDRAEVVAWNIFYRLSSGWRDEDRACWASTDGALVVDRWLEPVVIGASVPVSGEEHRAGERRGQRHRAGREAARLSAGLSLVMSQDGDATLFTAVNGTLREYQDIM